MRLKLNATSPQKIQKRLIEVTYKKKEKKEKKKKKPQNIKLCSLQVLNSGPGGCETKVLTN